MIYTVTLNPAIDRTLTCEDFSLHTVNICQTAGIVPAGKGINVSRCLSAFDIPSTACGFIGEFEHDRFRTFLEQKNVTSELTPVKGMTRINTTIIHTGRPETHIKEEGFNVTGSDIAQFASHISDVVSSSDIVAICGSLPMGYSLEELKNVILTIKEKDAELFLDLAGNLLRETASCAPSLIKPNLEELTDLSGTGTIYEMLFKAHEMGFEEILCTLGKEGAVYFNGTEMISASSPLISLVNSVGAGDASLAGYTAALSSGLDPEERIKWAAAAGAANAQERFAGVIDKDLFDKALGEVVIKRVEE